MDKEIKLRTIKHPTKEDIERAAKLAMPAHKARMKELLLERPHLIADLAGLANKFLKEKK